MPAGGLRQTLRRQLLVYSRNPPGAPPGTTPPQPASYGPVPGLARRFLPSPRLQLLKTRDPSTTEGAKQVGKTLAERAKAAGVSQVIFDRSGYLYHGRVKALADAAREGGLDF